MKKSTLVFTIIGILFLLGGIAAGLYLVRERHIFFEKAAPASIIYITPATQTKALNEQFTFSVDMDTASNQVNTFDIRLKFNPAVMQVVSMQKGSGVPFSDANPIFNVYDNNAGTIRYALYTTDVTNVINGSGKEVLLVNAVVTGTAADGSYPITIDSGSLAGDINETQNVIISRTDGTLVVSAAGAATPTSVPTPTSTSVPTPTSTSELTGEPTPTSTSEPTATPTPTNAGAGATSTATPTSTAVSASNLTAATPKPTVVPGELPASGVEWPTIVAGAFGVIVIFGSVLLAI